MISPASWRDAFVITYEFPYNEHIRTLLRLENLALRCLHFVNSDHSIDHQAALSLLFEITEVASRLDLKRDILQDLERVRVHFSRFKDNPEIAQEIEAGIREAASTNVIKPVKADA